ncbi:sensor histidine kinase [Clostridium fungisolvens]|uniref:histidine kinase n=1 Tax=Clostridium fungisolvens TaxID=1604897 RepID=A0A6V8SEY2_9CLOT|nr:HAMP domain-containing sensor histidine kinase [Clostridium fungisolvens]GFP75769.1 Adaptive-response sensory-kinase SasA [Clostridium fungisolvens]
MIKDSETVISSNADMLSNYIESMKNTDIKNFNNINLSPGIHYIIYDENRNIIFSNTVNSIQITDRRQNKKLRNKDSFEKLNGTLSTSRVVDVKGKNYYIFVTKDFEDIGDKIGYIAGILFTISILGIIVSLISGNFLTKKLLRPIKDITKTAKEITSKSLSKRIVTNGAKDEISDLADTFNLMIGRLETDFEKQRRFVSDASHELRTPLAVIHGHVNMLYRWGKNDAEQLDKSLITLKSETENMNRLIENLLYLAKGDNEVLSIKKEEFKIISLFKEIVEETQLSYSNVEITYNSNDQLKVYADYSKLKQVLRILIDNSIKFSKDSAKIMINVENKGREVSITLTDNGIGIPKESLTKIFDRFYRVDESRNKTTGGTGLGLSIAKQIIQYHEGRISAESKLGEGTKINIYLPQLIYR